MNSVSYELGPHTTSRIIHDAQLLEGGAHIDTNGVLTPTAKQVDALAYDNLVEPNVKSFMQDTVDGRQITAYQTATNVVLEDLNSRIGANAVVNNVVAIRPENLDEQLREDAARKVRAQRLLDDNGLSIAEDLQTIIPELTPQTKENATEITERLRVNSMHLGQLAKELVQYPEFRVGNVVTVKRSGDVPRFEGSWRVMSVLANGKLRVVSPDGTGEKRVSVDYLRKARVAAHYLDRAA